MTGISRCIIVRTSLSHYRVLKPFCRISGCSIQVSQILRVIVVDFHSLSIANPLQCYSSIVGYLNYRYFVNFLVYVCLGMGYGAILSARSFVAMSFGRQTVSEVWRPNRGDETAIAFSFMLCLSIGLAVACLGGFHLYLLLTAQTTIEFHGKSHDVSVLSCSVCSCYSFAYTTPH